MSNPPDNTDSLSSTPKRDRDSKKREHPDSDLIATLRRKKRPARSSNATDDPAPSFHFNSNKDSEDNDNDIGNMKGSYDHVVKLVSTTLMKSKPSHSNSKDNLGKSLNQIRNEREEYAKLEVMEKLRVDRAVANLVKPRNDALVRLTTNVARRVTQRLESMLASDDNNDEYAHLAKWTKQDNHEKETPMYPWISAFFGFVSREIGLQHRESYTATRGRSGINRPRALLSFEKTNVNPDGSDDYTRTDILLRANHRDASGNGNAQHLAAKPNYKDVVAVIEVKHLTSEETQAFAQLIIYSRNLYANQHNRRFVWGFTVCGSHVRACVLTSDNIFASAIMDVNKHKGRKVFVSLLVKMSYCAEDQMGYDPTIRLDDRGNIDEIDVYDEDADRMVPYKCVAMTAIATRCFGRHTRCFLCKKAASAQPDANSSSSSDDDYIVIKSAWAYSTRCTKDGSEKSESENARRNEAMLMRRIAKGLEGIASVDGKYAKLIHGGTVWFEKGGGGTEEDNTDTAFGAVFSSDSKEELPEFRINQRLAMTPWCRPLQNVANVDQLIVAVADVMEAHTAIFKECRILHRDISLNNMMFRDLDDGSVGGVLIDFDCAKDIEAGSWETRPERTGTLPYMNINNLEAASLVKRTQLDDWESLIYVLCWLGTTGINDDDGEAYSAKKQLPINSWQHDDPEKVAESKRLILNTPNSFFITILRRFLKSEYSELSALVEDLYMTLFFNEKLSLLSHGTFKVGRFNQRLFERDLETCLDKDDDIELRDLFERRAKYAEQIADDLLQVILEERSRALERINKRNSQAQSQPAVI
ncbi:hypothetical protein H4217_002915 [Coemansia sp. RSA 1939]|nr:hypothetical protein H4217_002915 [Coemansia sp. RSA 1939]KAJ2610720.1 hypothetical protein EV177_003839 [Coemansia sp. RSA 1804]KAJ2692986.1 hypothetical protein GGH99_001393 [Coemansia sp. RSA 1285]